MQSPTSLLNAPSFPSKPKPIPMPFSTPAKNPVEKDQRTKNSEGVMISDIPLSIISVEDKEGRDGQKAISTPTSMLFLQTFTSVARQVTSGIMTNKEAHFSDVQDISEYLRPFGYPRTHKASEDAVTIADSSTIKAFVGSVATMQQTFSPDGFRWGSLTSSWTDRKVLKQGNDSKSEKDQAGKEDEKTEKDIADVNDILFGLIEESDFSSVVGKCYQDLLFGVACIKSSIDATTVPKKIKFTQIPLNLFAFSVDVADEIECVLVQTSMRYSDIIQNLRGATVSPRLKQTLLKATNTSVQATITPAQSLAHSNSPSATNDLGETFYELIVPRKKWEAMKAEALLLMENQTTPNKNSYLIPLSSQDVPNQRELEYATASKKISDKMAKDRKEYTKNNTLFDSESNFHYLVIHKDTMEIIMDTPINENPFTVVRWNNTRSNGYASGLLMSAFSSIKQVNFIANNLATRIELTSKGVYMQVKAQAQNTEEGTNTKIKGHTVIDVESNSDSFPSGKSLRLLEMSPPDPYVMEMLNRAETQVKDIMFSEPFGDTMSTVRTATEISLRKQDLVARIGVSAVKVFKELHKPILRTVFLFAYKLGYFDEPKWDFLHTTNMKFDNLTPTQTTQQQIEVASIQEAMIAIGSIVSPEIVTQHIDFTKVISRIMALAGHTEFLSDMEARQVKQDEQKMAMEQETQGKGGAGGGAGGVKPTDGVGLKGVANQQTQAIANRSARQK